jgi:hypothetical protein
MEMTVCKKRKRYIWRNLCRESMTGTWCWCSLLRTLTDSSPRVPSYWNPDKSSIVSEAWSQFSPLPLGSCDEAPDKKPYSPQSTVLFDVFVGAIVGKRDEGAIPWVHIASQFFVFALSVCGSIPKSPVPPHILWGDVAWCPASRTMYSCPCPSVGFCATSQSWDLCHESPCTMLTWAHQTTLLCGDCRTLVPSQ